MSNRTPADETATPEGWWTRDHALVVVLVAATALLLFLCWLIVQPFLGTVAWALALAIVAHPLHGWIARHVGKVNVAAGLAVFAIALVIVAPAIFVGHNIVQEAATGAQNSGQDSKTESGRSSWRRVHGLPRRFL